MVLTNVPVLSSWFLRSQFLHSTPTVLRIWVGKSVSWIPSNPIFLDNLGNPLFFHFTPPDFSKFAAMERWTPYTHTALQWVVSVLRCCSSFSKVVLGLTYVCIHFRTSVSSWKLSWLLFYCCNQTPRPRQLRKHLIWGSCFPRVRVMAILVGSMAVGRQTWHWRSSRELTSVHECEAEKKRTIWEYHGFYKPQSLPQWHTFSYKATTLNLSQTVPPTVEKTFKQMSLKKTFSFKLPHCKPWLP